MTRTLERFIAWSDGMLRRHERGDPEAEAWCGFINLTAISVGVVLAVLLLMWWLA
jgi:hypothetical protein